jgi:hypothetical protein
VHVRIGPLGAPESHFLRLPSIPFKGDDAPEYILEHVERAVGQYVRATFGKVLDDVAVAPAPAAPAVIRDRLNEEMQARQKACDIAGKVASQLAETRALLGTAMAEIAELKKENAKLRGKR